MGEALNPGLSVADVMALIASNAAISYVSPPSAPLTVAQLMAQFPASSATMGQYARVSDLYGSVDEIVRCRFDGSSYRWVPQRDQFSGINASTGGAVSLLPLVTPPIVSFTANTLSNMTITPSVTNAYIGQTFRIYQQGAIGALLGVTINGLIGGISTLLTGGTKTLVYEAAGWRAS